MREVRKAIVLAAGRGTRMGSLTADLPKPMLALDGKPMLEHILDRMAEAGIGRVLMIVGYRREVILDHFREYRALAVHYAVQEQLNGTGAAVLLGREFAGDDPFLLTFGDIICDPDDYRGLCTTYGRGCAGVLGAKHVEDPWQGAAIYEEDGVVRRIIEKPPKGTSTTHWNSAGLYVFGPELFPYLERLPLSERGEYELTTAIGNMLEDGRRLLLYAVQGGWRDVGRPEDLDVAADIVQNE